jgi:glycerol-3-phosphate acyltransferase PlsY
MYDAIAIFIAYLIGAIPFGLLIPKVFGISDLRKHGSGNIGSTNAWRAAGPLAGILVMVLDIGKGVLGVLIAGIVPYNLLNIDILALLCGLAAVIGHIFPIYLKFKGGKGVNTALGVMLTLLTIQALIGLAVFIVTAGITRYISLGSIFAVTAFFIAVVITWLANLANINPIYVITALILNILIILVHHTNIKRLLNGNENKFSFHSEKDVDSNQVGENV